MSARSVRRGQLTLWLGIAGSLIGVVAGLVQATIGTRIPEWTGAKQAPLPLGLLTVVLSVLAGLAAGRQRHADLSIRSRAACALGLIGPGLLGLSTVGRLWYLPALLMLAAGVLAVDSWRRTASAVAADWLRVLLSALGAGELLMAVAAPPALAVIGAFGGGVLITAAWVHVERRAYFWGLVVLGTVPFAAFAWTSIVPLFVTVEAVAIAAFLPRHSTPTNSLFTKE